MRTLLFAVTVGWAVAASGAQSIVQKVSDVSFGAKSGAIPIFEAPTIYHDELYFSASTNEEEQTRLFKTNGRQVNSFDVSPGHAVGTQAIEFQGQLYFRGDDGNGIELFRTDGETLVNLDLSSGPEGSWPYNFNIVGNDLYFQGGQVDAAGNVRSYMFHTNGSVVTALGETDSNGSYPWGASAGGKFYFPGNSSDGFELHRADGPTSRQIIDVNPGVDDSDPWPAGELNGEFYFTAIGPNGRGLYRTEGDGAIQLPYEPNPGATSGPVNFVQFEDSLYFQGKGEDGYELYRTDGQSVTHLDLNPGPLSSGAFTYDAQEVDGKLIVSGKGPNGWAIFVIDSDGNLEKQFDLGEVPLTNPPAKDFDEELEREEARGFSNSRPLWLHEFQGNVYFQGTGTSGPDLYATDGETLTKFNLVPTYGDHNRGVGTYQAKSLGDALYFSASTINGVELVKTDGVSTTVFDLASGLENSYPWQLEVVGDEIVFQTYFDSITTIFATDGTIVRRLAEFPDLVTEAGYGYPHLVRSATSFMRFRDTLMFLGRTEQGWRLHRIAAVPEPLGIAMIVFALAGLAAARRRRAG